MEEVQIPDEEMPQPRVKPRAQIVTFHRGTTPEAIRELNMSAGGSLLKLGEDNALEVIERVASNDDGWKNERSKSYRMASVSDYDRMDMMSKQLYFLTSKFGFMGTEPSGLESRQGVEDVNYIHQCGNNGNLNNYHPNQGGGNYNHYRNKVHPKLSHGNANNALQPPPGFQVSNGQVKELKKVELKEVLMTFIKHTSECMTQSNQRLDNIEANVEGLNVHMKIIDTQLSQICQTMGTLPKPGQFPGNISIDPVNHKECKAICASIQPDEVEEGMDKETAEVSPCRRRHGRRGSR